MTCDVPSLLLGVEAQFANATAIAFFEKLATVSVHNEHATSDDNLFNDNSGQQLPSAHNGRGDRRSTTGGSLSKTQHART